MTESELEKQVMDYITSNGHDPKWIPSLLGQARVLNTANLNTVYFDISYNKQGGVIMTTGVQPIRTVESLEGIEEKEERLKAEGA